MASPVALGGFHGAKRTGQARERDADGGAPEGKRSSTGLTPAKAKEDDERRLEQRRKQIMFGKNTVGYQMYCAAVPRSVCSALQNGLRAGRCPDWGLRLGRLDTSARGSTRGRRTPRGRPASGSLTAS